MAKKPFLVYLLLIATLLFSEGCNPNSRDSVMTAGTNNAVNGLSFIHLRSSFLGGGTPGSASFAVVFQITNTNPVGSSEVFNVNNVESELLSSSSTLVSSITRAFRRKHMLTVVDQQNVGPGQSTKTTMDLTSPTSSTFRGPEGVIVNPGESATFELLIFFDEGKPNDVVSFRVNSLTVNGSTVKPIDNSSTTGAF